MVKTVNKCNSTENVVLVSLTTPKSQSVCSPLMSLFLHPRSSSASMTGVSHSAGLQINAFHIPSQLHTNTHDDTMPNPPPGLHPASTRPPPGLHPASTRPPDPPLESVKCLLHGVLHGLITCEDSQSNTNTLRGVSGTSMSTCINWS